MNYSYIDLSILFIHSLTYDIIPFTHSQIEHEPFIYYEDNQY